MKHPAFVCCAVSFLFLGATSVQAQETSDLTDVHFYPPSAVSMMKYIDYPVSHRTGIPEISIPLYTVRSGSLELPVNLSFHLDDFTRVNPARRRGRRRMVAELRYAGLAHHQRP